MIGVDVTVVVHIVRERMVVVKVIVMILVMTVPVIDSADSAPDSIGDWSSWTIPLSDHDPCSVPDTDATIESHVDMHHQVMIVMIVMVVMVVVTVDGGSFECRMTVSLDSWH